MAGDSVNYIVNIKNTGSDTAFNVRLADTLPDGFTYDDGSDGSWFFENLEAGEEMNHIYSVTVNSDLTAGTYTNTAQVSADNHEAITDTADLTVTEPVSEGVVLGAATEAGDVAGAEDELPQAGSSILFWLASLLPFLGIVRLRKI